jgi:hypothetical protein
VGIFSDNNADWRKKNFDYTIMQSQIKLASDIIPVLLRAAGRTRGKWISICVLQLYFEAIS